jgi:hypothetical protein
MYEKQEIEQYFFDGATLHHLANLASCFVNPCCLCTPSLGEELERQGVRATTLDIDGRFAHLEWFRLYDIGRPEPLDEEFGIIICDPPILNASLPQLLHTITLLSRGNYKQPLLFNYLSRRATTVVSTFSAFGLLPTGYKARYTTIANIGHNQMEFFGNLSPSYKLMPMLPVF